ncbi:MAG: tyrosine--tRNA ligase [bacterium]
MKVSTDKKLIDKFLTRGVEKIYPTEEALRKKLMSGERLKIYQGFDPTGKYLHVGHAMGIRALRILQELGHEVIFLIGDFTAKIGDPDKDTTRDLLTDEEIEKNMAGWKSQAGQLIDFSGENAVRFKRNSEWLAKLRLEDIIKLLSNITVQQMLTRDLFERRIKNEDPIRLHEFTYPLLQGYDGVAMGVDMEIGGADQTFNMLAGRDLSMAYLNKEKFVRTNKMMDAPDARTMSKTKGNGINLSDTADDMYGKAMSYPDNLITMGLELLSDVSMDEIKNIEKEMKVGANPMDFKKMMAFEIVKIVKGESAAQKAQMNFINQFSKHQLPEDIKEFKFNPPAGGDGMNIIDLLIKTNLVSSKGEGRRMVQQGGVKIDGETVDDIEKVVDLKKEFVLQKGKRGFARVGK